MLGTVRSSVLENNGSNGRYNVSTRKVDKSPNGIAYLSYLSLTGLVYAWNLSRYDTQAKIPQVFTLSTCLPYKF